MVWPWKEMTIGANYYTFDKPWEEHAEVEKNGHIFYDFIVLNIQKSEVHRNRQ